MKKVKISNEARKAIHIAGKRAAEIAKNYCNPDLIVKVRDLKYLDVEIAIYSFASCGSHIWTENLYLDAIDAALDAFTIHITRHNARVCAERGRVGSHYLCSLAKNKHNRKHNPHIESYNYSSYFSIRRAAERAADMEAWHNKRVKEVKQALDALATICANMCVNFNHEHPNTSTAVDCVNSAILRICGNAGNNTPDGYLQYFTAAEYSDFITYFDNKVTNEKYRLILGDAHNN